MSSSVKGDDRLLRDQIILVTGGSTGIGRASVELFGRHGAKVVFVGRREAEGRRCEKDLQDGGIHAEFVPCDVSQEGDLNALFEFIQREFGRLDGAFNCGGVDGKKNSLLDTNLQDFDEILNINLRGTFMLVQREIKMMLPFRRGTIINMSSVCAVIARPGRVAYNASRHGIDAITKTAALEYSSSGIRVNAIAPGSIRTDIFYRSTMGDPAREMAYNAGHPIGRIGEPEEIAQAALWLMSEAPSFMAGHTLMIDGGFTIQ